MFESHTIRAYDYVTRPYDEVRDALRVDPVGLFQRATAAATTRANTLASLHVKIGAVDIATDAIITVTEITTADADAGTRPVKTTLVLEWRAARAAAWFPVMKAELSAYPLSKDETQIDFEGQYQAPLGLLGGAIDAIVGRRIAEATVHRFVESVAARLRLEGAGKSRSQ
ncbi:MAG: hypothetical protein ACHREM_28620 [Polyangiales bacterium]